MEFRILGPLEAWDGGSEISLGGPKPRALLTLLLLHANEVVPADRLIDDLWGEDLPEDGAAALRVNVSRLRKALPQDVLTTRSPGYVVRVDPDALDLYRFERLVDEGRNLLARGHVADASERLHGALSLWRGPALADFAYESFAQAAIARLEELRLAAVELRIDADLAFGRHDELLARARGARRLAPAPGAPAGRSDDGALPVGPAGGGAGGLSGRTSRSRRRAGDRAGERTPGARGRDPQARPVAGSRSGARSRRPRCRRAGDPRRDRRRDARTMRCSRLPSRSSGSRLGS